MHAIKRTLGFIYGTVVLVLFAYLFLTRSYKVNELRCDKIENFCTRTRVNYIGQKSEVKVYEVKDVSYKLRNIRISGGYGRHKTSRNGKLCTLYLIDANDTAKEIFSESGTPGQVSETTCSTKTQYLKTLLYDETEREFVIDLNNL
jgi:hypothetical protein